MHHLTWLILLVLLLHSTDCSTYLAYFRVV